MSFNAWMLTIILFWPLLASLVVLLLPSEQERQMKNFAIWASLLPLLLATYLLWDYGVNHLLSSGFAYSVNVLWIPQINVHFHIGVDGLGLVMVFLTTLLTTLSLWYSKGVIHKRVKEYFFLFLFMEMGMLGVFLSLDLVLFYLFWEVGLVPMYLLIGVWGGKNRLYASIKFFLYTLTGSVAMLLAFIALYLKSGTFDIVELSKLHPFQGDIVLGSLVFFGIFLGFTIKLPAWPFHTWLPDAHTEAPTAGSVMLAGVMLKLGAFGYLRILLPILPQAFIKWSMLVVALGVISIVYGAFVCIAQTDLKRLIAYSSVSHMGYVLLGIGAAVASMRPGAVVANANSAAVALNGATLQMFNHGIITGGLFFLVGFIYERAHTRDLGVFGGLSGKTPYYYGLFLITALASLGLPGLAGFWAEFFVFRGAFDIVRIWAIVGVLGVVLTAAYILWRIVQSVFLGQFNEERWGNKLTDVVMYEKVTMWPLVIIMVIVGLYPTIVVNFLNQASVNILSKLP